MGKRILLIEDDAAIRHLVSDLLSGSGHLVVSAASGRQGLELLKDARPDLILLDKLMPDGDGTAFATDYRKTDGPHAPIIALCAARDGAEWANAIGAVSYIVKPFDIDVLIQTVQEHLGERV